VSQVTKLTLAIEATRIVQPDHDREQVLGSKKEEPAE